MSVKNNMGNEYRIKIDRKTLVQALNGLTLGRADNNDFILNESGVSRSHLNVSLVDHKLVIKDLGSANGTVVNGRRLEKGQQVVLNDGDKVCISSISGKVQFL